MYGVEPEIVKSLQVYLQLAQVLPKLVSSQSVQVVPTNNTPHRLTCWKIIEDLSLQRKEVKGTEASPLSAGKRSGRRLYINKILLVSVKFIKTKRRIIYW